MKSSGLISLVAITLVTVGCSSMHHGHARFWSGVEKAVAVMHPTQGNRTSGVVSFEQTGEFVKIVADIKGLKPNAKHAIHVHALGDCSAPDAKSAGSHYNPSGHPHGSPRNPVRHAGDLGNLVADNRGEAHYELTVHNISIAGLRNPVIGRAVIIHAGEDKFVQPTGAAGPRIACGCIGVAK